MLQAALKTYKHTQLESTYNVLMNSQSNNLLSKGLVGAQSNKFLNLSHHTTLSLQGHDITRDSKGMGF